MSLSTPADGPATQPAVESVLHEEQLRIAVTRYATERIRVRKVIVHEERTLTITVRREELRITSEPLPADAPVPGPDQPQPAEIIITLHEENPVVTLHTRPVERVRIARHIETELRTLTESVGREQVDITQGVSTDVLP